MAGMLAEWAISNWSEIGGMWNSPLPPSSPVLPAAGWRLETYGGTGQWYPSGGGLTREAFTHIKGAYAPGNGDAKWSSQTYVPSGHQAQPYLAAIGGQYIAGSSPGNDTAGLWLQQRTIGGTPQFRHVASFWAYGPVAARAPAAYPKTWASPLPIPEVAPSWVPNMFPPLTRPGALPGHWPTPRPLDAPRPDPWSPESPEVGPRPDPAARPSPAPAPSPWVNPLPEPFPDPGIAPQPAPAPAPVHEIHPSGRVVTRTNPQPRPRARPHLSRRPTKGVKESKIKAGRWFGWAWAAIGGVTEGVDFIENIYEALPTGRKVDAYNNLGRQPNPIEKLGLIYTYNNEVDFNEAMEGYWNQQSSDRISAVGSDQMPGANQNDGRPIGYESGGALGGGFGTRPNLTLW